MQRTHGLRKDLLHIASLVHPKSTVLELGCGEGDLLSYLAREKHIDGRGIELAQEKVSMAVQKGVSVIQGNAESDLKFYPDNCFDYVICSDVLQATYHPKHMLEEMVRVGKKIVVSIPNFGHLRNRYHLACKGQMPVTKALSYQWYETPNIHFCTIRDFQQLCKKIPCYIERSIYLNQFGQNLPNPLYRLFPNIFSNKAIFILKKITTESQKS